MKRYRNEKGSVMLVVAIALVVLLGFTALAIDGGQVYLGKSSLQNAADAAALAGAWDLGGGAAKAQDTAVAYAALNGMKATNNGIKKDGDTVTVTTPFESDSNKIEVVCTRTVPYTFARVLGFKQADVSARAVAERFSTGGNLGPEFGYTLFHGDTAKTLTITGGPR